MVPGYAVAVQLVKATCCGGLLSVYVRPAHQTQILKATQDALPVERAFWALPRQVLLGDLNCSKGDSSAIEGNLQTLMEKWGMVVGT